MSYRDKIFFTPEYLDFASNEKTLERRLSHRSRASGHIGLRSKALQLVRRAFRWSQRLPFAFQPPETQPHPMGPKPRFTKA